MPWAIDGREVYVGCLDVLGFKDIFSRHPEALVKAYHHFVGLAKIAGGMHMKIALGDPNAPLVERELGYRKLRGPVVFSDTVLLLTDDASEESLMELCLYANTVFRNAFRANIPMRGALARGRLWHEPKDGITLGEAVLRAYELEQSLEILGIVLDESLPATRAASLPLPIDTKTGKRRLRVPLRRMRGKHPEHLAQDVPLEGWGARLGALRGVAPEGQKAKYDNSVGALTAMFEASPE